MPDDRYVTASEIGEFTYCKRAWWLHANGLLPTTEQMTKGTEGHNRLAQHLYRHTRLVTLAILLLSIGLLGILLYVGYTYFLHFL